MQLNALQGSHSSLTAEPSTRLSKVAELPAFERTLFSSCWEDTETEIEALQLEPGSRVLSITASGGRSLNVLRSAPSEVISVDLNPSQNALLELKKTSLVAFDSWEEHATFLGVIPGTPQQRLGLFAQVLPHLTLPSRAYWCGRINDIRGGVVHCGRQDRMINYLRPVVRAFLDRRKLEELFTIDDIDEQVAFFEEHFDTPFARNLVRMAGTKSMVSWIYWKDLYGAADSFGPGKMALDGIRRHVRARLLKENYFLQHVILGRLLDPRHCNSYYLQEPNFEEAKERQEAIRIVTAPLEDVLASIPDGSIDAFSFSDIFDWIEDDAFHRLMREVIRVSRHGARMCYRVCLVGRYPTALSPWIQPDAEARDKLFARDRSCFYRDLFVGTIDKQASATLI